MADKDASILFSSWILLVQIASKCTPRGTLIRGDGTPHTDVSLTLKCRCPDDWMTLALKWFPENTDWIEVQEFACERQSDVTLTSVGRHLPAKEEGIGGEGKKGRDGMGENAPPPKSEFKVPSWEEWCFTCSNAGIPEWKAKEEFDRQEAMDLPWKNARPDKHVVRVKDWWMRDGSKLTPERNNGKSYGNKINGSNSGVNTRNAGTCPPVTDYGEAGKRQLERQRARLDKVQPENETGTPTA